jgi:hypothetical protein
MIGTVEVVVKPVTPGEARNASPQGRSRSGRQGSVVACIRGTIHPQDTSERYPLLVVI